MFAKILFVLLLCIVHFIKTLNNIIITIRTFLIFAKGNRTWKKFNFMCNKKF